MKLFNPVFDSMSGPLQGRESPPLSLSNEMPLLYLLSNQK